MVTFQLGPAVIATGGDVVYFFKKIAPYVATKKQAALRVHGGREGVTEPYGPDGTVVAGCLSVKRIVCGDATVIVEPEYLAQQTVHAVSGIGIGTIANRDVEFAVGAKMHATTIMDGASHGIQLKDNLLAADDGVVSVGRHAHNAVVIAAGYGIVKVDVVVLLEVGVKYQSSQASFIEVVDLQVNKRIW